jgi:endonuclease IV
MIRIGFSARPLEKHLKNPRPDGLGEYRRTIDIINACNRWGLHYYNMPPETVGWGDYSKYQPDEAEVERSFGPLLAEIRYLHRAYDIALSFHVRNSAVLTTRDETIRERSIKEVAALRKGLELAGGLTVYVHPGYAQGDEPAALQRIINILNSLDESPVTIGVETTDVGIGDLPTVLSICKQARGTAPVIDWGHLYDLGYTLQEPNDYLSIIETAEPFWQDYIYFHFSAVSRRKHMSLDAGPPDYRVFAKALSLYEKHANKDVIVLVESPHREADVLLLQNYLHSLSAAA